MLSCPNIAEIADVLRPDVLRAWDALIRAVPVPHAAQTPVRMHQVLSGGHLAQPSSESAEAPGLGLPTGLASFPLLLLPPSI